MSESPERKSKTLSRVVQMVCPKTGAPLFTLITGIRENEIQAMVADGETLEFSKTMAEKRFEKSLTINAPDSRLLPEPFKLPTVKS